MVIWKTPMWHLIKGNEKRNEPRYLTQHHLYSINPQIKIIVLMRNPVDRYGRRTTSSKKCVSSSCYTSLYSAYNEKRN
ncbi:hypothetical protein LSH36_224g07038 [Paralvinella palmiformis]|uniref:Sulfotransferase n=1 Tax=Paralvinella palmiformis TaxID=53620 RepID=A0AAD9JQ11_9ANNE|nr:hypothetical protein LSH36_224g07038 [Paralvinella palmiformis]